MKICGSRVMTGLALLLGGVLADPGTGRGQSAAYLDFQDFTGELRSLVEPSSLAAMESLGTTLEGREIWVVTVGDPSGSALDTRPGVLVVGNLEGDHLAGSQITLEAIRYLLANSEAEAVRSQLSHGVFYFLVAHGCAALELQRRLMQGSLCDHR
ncbi:MAG: M14 family zinc carboxypeptidase [Longimicrobiales bacterium]